MNTTVGFVPCLPPGLHPGMDALAEGLHRSLAAADMTLDIEPGDLRLAHPVAGQAKAIEALVRRGVSAVVLFCVSMTEPRRAVEQARRQGVRVVTIHHTAAAVDATLVVPNFAHGVILANALAQALNERTMPPRLAMVGPPDILDDLELTAGVIFGLQQHGHRLVNDPYAPVYRNLHDVAGQGVAAVERLLNDAADLDGLVVFNDETMLDAIEPLRVRGLLGTLPVVSRNGSPAIVEAVRRGDVLATFDYHLPEIGISAGRLVQRVLEGAVVPRHLESAPVGRLITRETAGDYRPWSDRWDADPDLLPEGVA